MRTKWPGSTKRSPNSTTERLTKADRCQLIRSEYHVPGPPRTSSELPIGTCKINRWRTRSRASSQDTQALFLVTNQLLIQAGHSRSWAEPTSRELRHWRLPDLTSCLKGSLKIWRSTMSSLRQSARSMAEIITSARDRTSTIPFGPQQADSHTETLFREPDQQLEHVLPSDSLSHYVQLTLRTMSRRTTSQRQEQVDLPATPFCSIRSRLPTTGTRVLLPSSSAPAAELPSRSQRETLTCRGWCRLRRNEAGFIWKCVDV